MSVAGAKPWLEDGEVAVSAPNALFSSQACSEVSAKSLINPKQQPQGHEGPTDMKPFKSALRRCRRNSRKTTRIIEPQKLLMFAQSSLCFQMSLSCFPFYFYLIIFSWFSVFPEITLSFFHKPLIHTVI